MSLVEPETLPEESVPDNRTLVTSTTMFPFNAVGLLQILYSSGTAFGQVQGLCSGALIAPNIVLTAAHCLLDPDTGTAVQAATFTPGYNPNIFPRSPYGMAVMQRWGVPQAFADCVMTDVGEYSLCDQGVDFGVMLLDTSFDQYMDFSHNSSNNGDETVTTAGYPGTCMYEICCHFDHGCLGMQFNTCCSSSITTHCALHNSRS